MSTNYGCSATGVPEPNEDEWFPGLPSHPYEANH
jgi:hypothetical protein